MTNSKLSEILPLLKNTKRTNGGFSSRCPSHDDNKNSLSVSEGETGNLLFNCFAGCTYSEIIAALGIPANGNGSQKVVSAIYEYKDETGNLLYQNVRFGQKDFRQRHFDKDGREVWNLKGVRRVPYRLPELTTLTISQDVVMTEGEKDADALTKLGFPATNHKNWQSDFNYLLREKNVFIFQDHDLPGVKQAEKAAKMICRDAKAVKIVDCFADESLPEKHGRDVSDYLKNHSFEELRELINNTPVYCASDNKQAKDESKNLKVVCFADVETKEIVWLWNPFVPIGEFTILEGIEGLGKSWTCCAIACAVADGKRLPFSESEPIEPCNVLMLSAEDSLKAYAQTASAFDECKS